MYVARSNKLKECGRGARILLQVDLTAFCPSQACTTTWTMLRIPKFWISAGSVALTVQKIQFARIMHCWGSWAYWSPTKIYRPTHVQIYGLVWTMPDYLPSASLKAAPLSDHVRRRARGHGARGTCDPCLHTLAFEDYARLRRWTWINCEILPVKRPCLSAVSKVPDYCNPFVHSSCEIAWVVQTSKDIIALEDTERV